VYGGIRLHVDLCVLFHIFVKHGYVPIQFMKCVTIPLAKCKTGDLSDVNNYRAIIAISTSISKLLGNDIVLSVHIKCYDYYDAYQFCVSSGCSTSLCTDVLKQVVDRYTHGGSHVFAGFLDFSKAFDKVSYWRLFHKLSDDDIDVGIVRLLAFWYSHQQACIHYYIGMIGSRHFLL